jgi:nicotinamidase-related amidase
VSAAIYDGTPAVLLVVDVQRCFLNDYTRHLPARVAKLIERASYDHVLFTRFANTEDSPYRRLLDWHECETDEETALPPELVPFSAADRVFVKPGLAGIPQELADYLTDRRIPRAHVVGIDTDMCVLKVAMDLFDMGIEPVVLVDCCASTAGLQAHLAGLAVLSRNLGPHQLRDAGLGEGYLASPE